MARTDLKSLPGGKRHKNIFNSFAAIVVVAVFVFIMWYQVGELKAQERQLDNKEAILTENYERESSRTQELEEKKKYVQTIKYIEEEAKKIGFVYPDEVIFKPMN